jgi:diguanylate cyclase (GGDEF)-like protein
MKTIGFLCPAFNDDYLLQLVRGAASAAAELDLNFLAYVSQGQDAFFDIISERRVDGLVIPAHYFTYQRRTDREMIQFFERFKPLLTVSIGMALEGIPSVTVDNRTGLYEEISHLIEVHKFTKIAYFGGPDWNPEALERRETYLKALTDHGLPIDQNLIFKCGWGYKEGEMLIGEMLDIRKVRPEAIVGSNDNTAIDSIEALARRGIKVPSDIAVVGFDDTVDARYQSRPLTTVRQPVFEVGATAAQVLSRMLDGKKDIPAHTRLGTIFLVRQTCRCLPLDVKDAVTAQQLEQPATGKLESARTQIVAEASALFHLKPGDRILNSIDQLFDAFRLNMSAESAQFFIHSLDEVVRDDSGGENDQLIWQAVISIMRRKILPLLPERELTLKAENLFHVGRIIVAGATALAIISRSRKNEMTFWSLSYNPLLFHIDNLERFGEALNSVVKRVGVQRCYIGLTSDNRYDTEARLLFAYDAPGKREMSAAHEKFDSRDIAPWPLAGRFCLFVQPMQSRTGPMGFMAIEMANLMPQVLLDVWRQSVSSLNGLLMIQEIREQNYKLESEIKARQEAEKELQFRAFHDALTRLPNRALFLDRLSQADATASRRSDFRYAVMFIDLDGFKKHNDTHGHEGGDELLIAVAERLRRCVRSVDTLARMGGDEFTVLLSDLNSRDGAEQVAKRVLDELTQPFELNSGTGSISASIGIAFSGKPGTSHHILQNADVAMYRAKNAGKAQYVIFSENALS